MSFSLPAGVEAEMDEMISHYPMKRSASLMLLHAIQKQCGHISPEAMEWAARKLEVEPINIYELVTFYPMFRQEKAGRYQIKICRTLSCALKGGEALRAHICRKLGLREGETGEQTTPDGKFTVEFVECLAGCGAGPVMMVNEEFYEGVTTQKADEIVSNCK